MTLADFLRILSFPVMFFVGYVLTKLILDKQRHD